MNFIAKSWVVGFLFVKWEEKSERLQENLQIKLLVQLTNHNDRIE